MNDNTEVSLGGHNYKDPHIIYSNATHYLAGWDTHGWFTLQEVFVVDADGAPDAPTVEFEGREVALRSAGRPVMAFEPDGAEELAEVIQGGEDQ